MSQHLAGCKVRSVCYLKFGLMPLTCSCTNLVVRRGKEEEKRKKGKRKKRSGEIYRREDDRRQERGRGKGRDDEKEVYDKTK
jgi:hypothetical protein